MTTTHAQSTPSVLGLEPSFGYGDRFGLAIAGHHAAASQFPDIHPVFAQQSIRELARTNRQPRDVIGVAIEHMRSSRASMSWGADADHLKTSEDVDKMLMAGYTFYTIDPSDYVDQDADGYKGDLLKMKFAQCVGAAQWYDVYLDRRVDVPGCGVIHFDEATLQRAVVKYATAIEHAVKLARYVKRQAKLAGLVVELELSVDETKQPTTAAEHYLIADHLRHNGVQIISLAPRLPGHLEKGIDYKGDTKQLEDAVRQHAAIANFLGPYKLSLHSGSDKLSIYRMFARLTRGLFHVKTAGTSYLEALRLVANKEPDLFREVIRFSRTKYEVDRATYHVSAELCCVTDPDSISDLEDLIEIYLGHWHKTPSGRGFHQPGRQILHCCFGSVLSDVELGSAIKSILIRHSEAHRDVLEEHFVRHLAELKTGLDEGAVS